MIQFSEINSVNKDEIYIEYYITLSCPNRCEYCFMLDKLDNNKKINYSVFNETITAIKKYKELNPNKNINITLLGGDCLSVYKETIKFCEELKDISTINLFSNLNYNPNSNTISEISKYLNENNIMLTVSWHESSNQNWIKENILKFNNLRVTWVLSNNNLDKHYEDYRWLKENTNKEYSIEPMKVNNSGKNFNLFNSIIYKEMMLNSLNFKIGKGFEEEEIKNIALNNITICRCSNIRINYDGSVESFCNYPTNWKEIKFGLPEIKDVVCNYTCDCTILNYKKIGNKNERN